MHFIYCSKNCEAALLGVGGRDDTDHWPVLFFAHGKLGLGRGLGKQLLEWSKKSWGDWSKAAATAGQQCC